LPGRVHFRQYAREGLVADEAVDDATVGLGHFDRR
jgi:hypothetical protein